MLLSPLDPWNKFLEEYVGTWGPIQELKLIEVDLMVFHHRRQQMAGTQPLRSPNSQGQGTGVEIIQQVGSYMVIPSTF